MIRRPAYEASRLRLGSCLTSASSMSEFLFSPLESQSPDFQEQKASPPPPQVFWRLKRHRPDVIPIVLVLEAAGDVLGAPSLTFAVGVWGWVQALECTVKTHLANSRDQEANMKAFCSAREAAAPTARIAPTATRAEIQKLDTGHVQDN